MKTVKTWKEYCTTCKKYHVVSSQKCPSCGIHKTPQPVSETVHQKHLSSKYECDGCEAYKDHQS